MTEKVCVFSAAELAEKDKARIEKIFKGKHGAGVVFEYSVDSTLMGGLLVIDGNDYYDSTVAGRYAKFKRGLQ